MARIELAIGPGKRSKSCRVQVLESEYGPASAEVPLDVASLSARRRELEQAVIASADPKPKNPRSTDPLREIGQTLFAALLGTGPIAGRYAVSVAKAQEKGQGGLRVVLRIDTPELARLPWESMY